MGALTTEGSGDDKFSLTVGGFYIFNIIVGTGVLTLPLLFAESGLILSSIFLLLVAILCVTGVSFVVESCAVANGLFFPKQ